MHDFLKFLILVAVAVLVFMAWQHRELLPSFFWLQRSAPVVTFNEKTPLEVIVVESEGERIQGLSGRESLSPTQGMLFVFPETAYHGIWMKDMRFVIDIIWIDADGIIVDIAPSVRPDTYPQTFEPKTPARFVIETNAYFAESFGIKVGDSVELGRALAHVEEDTQ